MTWVLQCLLFPVREGGNDEELHKSNRDHDTFLYDTHT